MLDDACHFDNRKSCVILKDSNHINSLKGTKIIQSNPSDMQSMIDMGEAVMYGERSTLSGQKKILATKIPNSNYWMKLDVSKISSNLIKDSLKNAGCF